jgi:solute carrier family 25 2-oxodicarboxylate transporter 21
MYWHILTRLCVLLLAVASNDFWGKTFIELSPEKKMTQSLSIITGCAAGATESFVVVPFELVKIRCESSAWSALGDSPV